MYFPQQGTAEASPNSTTDWIPSVQTSEPMRGIFIPTTVMCVFGVFPIPCLELCTAADMVVWVQLVRIISWGVTQLGGVALLEECATVGVGLDTSYAKDTIQCLS